jgi:hypothetical protein
MLKALYPTGVTTDMMISPRSRMIKTEGTTIATTIVPLLAPVGASSSVLLLDIIITTG